MPPVPLPREEGFTTSTDVPLYWARYGEPSAPPLLVLHGGPGAHHDYLLPQMLALADRHEMLFYDQRGGGRSKTDAREPITAQTQVDDLRAVIEEFALDPPAIVGYSWGGLLAILYAIQTFRQRAAGPAPAPQRLVLIDPAPVTRHFRTRFEQELAARQQSDAIRAMREELAASGLRESDPEAYRHRLFELSVAGYFADPAAARDLTPFRVTGRVQQSVWESLGDFDLLPDAAAITCPCLVVHGRQDPIPVESSVQLAHAMGGSARLIVLDSCGHVPYVEQPDALFAAVQRFLGETVSLIPR